MRLTTKGLSDLELMKEFITLMNRTEISDNDREFRPNHITSCRVLDGKRLGELLHEMEKRVGYGKGA